MRKPFSDKAFHNQQAVPCYILKYVTLSTAQGHLAISFPHSSTDECANVFGSSYSYAVTERRGHVTEMCLSLIKIYIYIYAYKQCNNKITIKRPGWIRRLWGDIRAALQYLRGPTRKMVKDHLSGTVMIGKGIMVLNKIRLDLDLI